MLYKHIHIIGSGALGSLLCARALLHGYSMIRHPRSEAVAQVTLHNQSIVKLNTSLNQWPSTESRQLVILPLKSYQVHAALEQYEAHFTTDVDVLLVHNGMLDWPQTELNEKPYRLFAATTSIAAFKPSATAVTQTGQGETFVGALQSPADSNGLAQLNSVCSELFGKSSFSADIRRTQWLKLTVNSLINPLTAINGLRNGELIEERWQTELKRLASELSALAKVQGFDEPAESIMTRAQKVMQRTANNYSSMHQDVTHGRPTEIDAINGYALGIAKRVGIECPQLAEHYKAVKALVLRQPI